ncbi:MAG: L-threonylcarbamoyladenylate synthase [Deltaproteobacteria bacterium]
MPDPAISKRPIILGASSLWEEAPALFASSGIIAYPTETFYGLCVNPFDRVAIKKLFALKGRPPEKPITLIVRDREMLDRVASGITPLAERLMERFWPGPLTIIFNARADVPAELTGGTGTLGVRVSASPVATRLSALLDSPITATSANPTDKDAPTDPQDVVGYFDGEIDMLIDGGRLAGKKGSTIVDARGGSLVIFREGEIPVESLMDVVIRD